MPQRPPRFRFLHVQPSRIVRPSPNGSQRLADAQNSFDHGFLSLARLIDRSAARRRALQSGKLLALGLVPAALGLGAGLPPVTALCAGAALGALVTAPGAWGLAWLVDFHLRVRHDVAHAGRDLDEALHLVAADYDSGTARLEPYHRRAAGALSTLERATLEHLYQREALTDLQHAEKELSREERLRADLEGRTLLVVGLALAAAAIVSALAVPNAAPAGAASATIAYAAVVLAVRALKSSVLNEERALARAAMKRAAPRRDLLADWYRDVGRALDDYDDEVKRWLRKARDWPSDGPPPGVRRG